jgi:hypothetical protein
MHAAAQPPKTVAAASSGLSAHFPAKLWLPPFAILLAAVVLWHILVICRPLTGRL